MVLNQKFHHPLTKFLHPCYNYDNYALQLKYPWVVAREKLINRKNKVKEFHDKTANFVKLSIGEKILLCNETRMKLESIWEGPNEIIYVNSDFNSTIRIKNKNKIVHNNRLKLYFFLIKNTIFKY